MIKLTRRRPAPKLKLETSRVDPLWIEEQTIRFRTDKWTRRVIRPLLIALMATSVSIAFLVIAGIVMPEQSWMSLWVLCFIVALETAYTSTWLIEPGSHGVDKFVYRAAEFFLILVAVRLFSWVFFGTGLPNRAELEALLLNPLTLLLTGGFFTSASVALTAWVIAGALADTLGQLDLSVYEIRYYSLPLAERKVQLDDQPIQISRSTLVERFVRYWLFGGVILVCVAALSSFDLPELVTATNMLTVTRLRLHPAMLVSLLLYFLSGFWLLSYARMALMNARWLLNGVAKEANVERSWQKSSLLVLLAVAFLATLLPIGSTIPFGQIVATLLSVTLYILRLLFVLLLTPLAWLLSQLGRNTAPIDPLLEQPPPLQALPPQPEAAPPNEVATMLFSSAFWTLLIIVTVAAILFFLRERGYRLNRQAFQQLWQQFLTWARASWANFRGRAQQAGRSLRIRLPKRRDEEAAPKLDQGRPWRFVRLNNLSPRDQVRYFYLSTVRRASDRGLSRGNSETPLEYVRELKNKWPETEEDFDGLTDAFLEARYSRRPIEREAIHPLKAQWKRVRSRLRRNK